MLRHHPSALARRSEAILWVQQLPPGSPGIVVTSSLHAANALLRDALGDRSAAFGWHRFTFGQLAAQLGLPRLALAGRTPASPLAMEALAARVVFELGQAGRLGRFQPVAHRPGLPRALVRTLRELALAEVSLDTLPDTEATRDLRHVGHALASAGSAYGVATRAELLDAAVSTVAEGVHPLLGLPLLSLDVPVRSSLEGRLLGALLRGHSASVSLLPSGDESARRWLQHAGLSESQGLDPPMHPSSAMPAALHRLKAQLFMPDGTVTREPVASVTGDASVQLMSAPGESRECVELARRVLSHAQAGIPFERMAVLLRSPEAYHAHLREALGRANIPAHFTRGANRPEPGGRALLALLDCVIEGLSARALGEYLSLGVLPEGEDGAPPPAVSSADVFVPPDEEYLPGTVSRVFEEDDQGRTGSSPEAEEWDELDKGDSLPAAPDAFAEVATLAAGSRRLRAPRTWEALLIESRAVGGRERWTTRLRGLHAELALRASEVAAEAPDSPRARALAHRLASLSELQAFLFPLLDELSALPRAASWGHWVEALTRLSTRALRDPAPVLRALAELAPMGAVGPVSLTEVRLVLAERLGELRDPPSTQLAGKLFVGSPDDARGHSFAVVFVPGLAEKLFPKKVLEDPILLDAARPSISTALATSSDRVAEERLLLRLAVGAAEQAVVLSWPRVDTERGRPRVPSFYGLEVVRAAEGTLPDFHALEARAGHGAATRLGWPAPELPADAIDEAEYDLATLSNALGKDAGSATGAARYLLEANPHLGRALRARARRHNVGRFVAEDGLVRPSQRAAEALAKHRLAARPYSATALERYAGCPYQFYLNSIARLAPREVPERVEGLDPLTRGSFIHEAQFRILRVLREQGALPLSSEASLALARAEVTQVFSALEQEYRERLAPAIEDVFRSHMEVIHSDLLEWIARLAEPESGGAAFVPTHFELAFGLPARDGLDDASRRDPISLSAGVTLRGSIDLVERRGRGLRATDYKTGRNITPARLRLGGGQVLQPALYAMALEALFPEAEVSGGRLYFCTTRGDFGAREVPLDDVTRSGVADVLAAIDGALADGFLPPVPRVEGPRSECTRCDYVGVCGTGELRRVSTKVSRATAAARSAGDEADQGKRLIQLELLRRRE